MFLHIFQTYLVDCLEIRNLGGTVRTGGVRNVSMTLNVVTIKIAEEISAIPIQTTANFGQFNVRTSQIHACFPIQEFELTFHIEIMQRFTL